MLFGMFDRLIAETKTFRLGVFLMHLLYVILQKDKIYYFKYGEF